MLINNISERLQILHMNIDRIFKNTRMKESQQPFLQIGLRKYKKFFTETVLKKLSDWNPADKLSHESPIQVMDFFCGCGGMSLGFSTVSTILPLFKIIGGCDIDPIACKTYQRNFRAPAVQSDIKEMKRDINAFKSFLKVTDYNPKKPLIVIGCAPCQGFTSHRKKNWSKYDDRNTLVIDFASLVVRLNPECIIMENVPEFLSLKYWPYFSEVRDILKGAGYFVKQAIYNAASFGVPQERFRAVVIAMRKDFLLPEPLLKPDEYMTVRQAIGHLPMVSPGNQCPGDKLHRCANHRPETLEIIRAIPKNGGSRPPGVGPKCLDRITGFYDVYGRLSWNSPSITITHYARNPASGRFLHPEQDRGLTMREAALLQSFPTAFDFEGSFDQVFKQIGEAVPPKLACAVAANILIELFSAPPSESEKMNSVPSLNEPVSSSYSSVIAGIKSKRR